MKQLTDELRDFMLNQENAYVADIYEIAIPDGENYYLANGDLDIVYNDHIFKHGDFIIKRNQVRTEGTPTVDSLTFTIYDDQDDEHTGKIAGKKVFPAAYESDLDDATVTVWKAYVDIDTLATIGVMELFSGRVTTSTVSGLSVKITVKSEVTGLNFDFPPRIYAAQNAYFTSTSGTVITTTTKSDEGTAMIPLKPNQRVMVRLL